MKNILTTLMTALAIFLGTSITLFILRMIWSPPNAMGMMMGKMAMVHHMQIWMQGTFIVFLIIIIVSLIFWIVRQWLR